MLGCRSFPCQHQFSSFTHCIGAKLVVRSIFKGQCFFDWLRKASQQQQLLRSNTTRRKLITFNWWGLSDENGDFLFIILRSWVSRVTIVKGQWLINEPLTWELLINYTEWEWVQEELTDNNGLWSQLQNFSLCEEPVEGEDVHGWWWFYTHSVILYIFPACCFSLQFPSHHPTSSAQRVDQLVNPIIHMSKS